jgi:hypothetical protein
MRYGAGGETRKWGTDMALVWWRGPAPRDGGQSPVTAENATILRNYIRLILT